MEYRVQTVCIVDFIFPAEHIDDVFAMLDSYCEFEDGCWLINRDEQVIVSIEKEPTPFPDNEFDEEAVDDPIMQERLTSINSPYALSVDIYFGFDDVVYRPEELYHLVEMFLAVPQRYVLDGYLWTWIEIIRGFSFKRGHFLDFYTQHYGGGPYLDFSTDGLAAPISITDNIIEDWYRGGLSELKTLSYYNEPMKGIARYGVTTIPVTSIAKFRDIVKNSTSKHFLNISRDKITRLLAFLDMAEKENKAVVVDGV